MSGNFVKKYSLDNKFPSCESLARDIVYNQCYVSLTEFLMKYKNEVKAKSIGF